MASTPGLEGIMAIMFRTIGLSRHRDSPAPSGFCDRRKTRSGLPRDSTPQPSKIMDAPPKSLVATAPRDSRPALGATVPDLGADLKAGSLRTPKNGSRVSQSRTDHRSGVEPQRPRSQIADSILIAGVRRQFCSGHLLAGYAGPEPRRRTSWPLRSAPCLDDRVADLG